MTAKKKSRSGPNSRKQAEVAIRKAREREDRQAKLVALIVERRRFNDGYTEIARWLEKEGHVDRIHASTVKRWYLNAIRPKDALEDAFARELEILEARAGRILERLRAIEDEHDAGVPIDDETYSKLNDTYIKLRDRIAKLTGMDRGGSQGGLAAKAALEAEQAKTEQHLHVYMPGSVQAFEEYERLAGLGLTELASQVHELQSGEVIDADVVGAHNDAAGTVLAPAVKLPDEANFGDSQGVQPANSVEALALLMQQGE